jgi:hypothetical protein
MEFLYVATILALAVFGVVIFWTRRSVNNAPKGSVGPEGPQGPQLARPAPNLSNLSKLSKAQLVEFGESCGLSGVSMSMRKSDMLEAIANQLK